MRPSRSPLYQIVGATILLLVAGIIFIPAYLYWNRSIQHSVAALPDCGAAPRFESSDQLGRSVGTKELSGTIWVAGLIKNAKPGETEEFCSKCAELDQNFGGAKAIILVSFFDGADKNRVEDYARRYEASDRWWFIPISKGDSSTLLEDWSSAAVGCRREVQGQSLFLLIDRRGDIRGVYDASAPELVQNILFDAGNLLRAEHLAP